MSYTNWEILFNQENLNGYDIESGNNMNMDHYHIYILIMLAIVMRIHIWRIRKNQKKFLLEQQKNGDKNDLNNVVNNLHKLIEIQEQNQGDYFIITIFAIIIFIKFMN